VSAGRLVRKLVSPRPSFTMRVPDLMPPFHADNDACYLCNPVDLMRFFPRAGCDPVQVGKHGRPKWTAILAGGTWFAARKRRSAGR
jgi:hypothetical protein